jgi:NAD(P)-dependent dehydrogenase (short-subunit alcohol dehydrogenase family)
VLDAFGAVHVVHNNAGVALPPMPLWEVDDALWRWIIGVNLLGVINGIHTFVPLLVAQGNGHVVNTSSLGGLRAGARLGAYSATKHAVIALSESLAADLRRVGADVGVSVVCPSAVPTNLGETSARNWPDTAPRPDITEPRNDGSIPYTVLQPEAIADMVHDAILENRLYVITHPETRELIAPRFDAILEACPAVLARSSSSSPPDARESVR